VEVVRFVSEHFVPIAVDKQKLIHDQNARERFADERKIAEKFTGGNTGKLAVHLLTPDGEPLTSKEIFRMQSAGEVLATLKEAVAKFGPVPVRRIAPTWQAPDRGFGVRPDGSVRLAAHVRHTDRQDYTARPVFDSIILTKDQWSGLQPPDRGPGSTYRVPDPVARQFSRILSASSDLSNLIRPDDLTTVELSGTVSAPARDAAAASGHLQVTLTGKLAGTRPYVNGGDPLPGQARLAGILQLDSAGQPIRLLIVFDGTFKMPWDKSARPTAAVVEWQAKPMSSARYKFGRGHDRSAVRPTDEVIRNVKQIEPFNRDFGRSRITPLESGSHGKETNHEV
jgi:hypothetical protein